MSRNASNILKNFNKDIVPLIYIGKNEPIEELKKQFDEIWDEIGSQSTVTLYLQEMVDFSSKHLASSSWNLRRSVALAIVSISEAVGKNFNPYFDQIIKLLIEGLGGRIWKGKESFLLAITSICAACKTLIQEKYNVRDYIQILEKECKKNDKDYRRHALTALANLLKAYEEIDIFNEIYELLLPNISTVPSESSGKDEEGDKPREFLIKANSFHVLGYAFSKNYETQHKFVDVLFNLLCTQIHNTPWNVKLAILEALKVIVSRLVIPSPKPLLTKEMIDALLNALFLCLSDPKYSALRAASVDVILELSIKLKGTTLLNSEQKELLLNKLATAIQDTLLIAKINSIKLNLN